MPLFNPAELPKSEPWIAPDFLNGWGNYGSSHTIGGIWRDPVGCVHLRGLIGGGLLEAPMFVLPQGYRPEALESFIVLAAGPNAPNGSILSVFPSGEVQVSGNGSTYTSLAGVTFRAVE